MTIAAAVFLVLLLLNEVLMGRWWLWNIFSVVPPVAAPAIFVLLLGAVVWMNDSSGLPLVILSLPFVWRIADINVGKRTRRASKKTSITVFNWNTEHWEPHETLTAFYTFLKEQNADIYHLQERMDPDHVPYEDTQALRRHFPDYAVAEKGELLTLSRFPIIRIHDAPSGYLRVDLDIGGTPVSFYNVHIPVQFQPTAVRRPLYFLSGMRERFFRREKQFALLEEDVRGNPLPCYISGDFNTTTVMRRMRTLRALTRNCMTACSTIFPATWDFHGLRLWRIDWHLIKGPLTALSYREVWARRFSDHAGQVVRFVVS